VLDGGEIQLLQTKGKRAWYQSLRWLDGLHNKSRQSYKQ